MKNPKPENKKRKESERRENGGGKWEKKMAEG